VVTHHYLAVLTEFPFLEEYKKLCEINAGWYTKLPESSFTFESDTAALYFVENNALLKSIKIFLFMPINSQNNKPALSMCSLYSKIMAL